MKILASLFITITSCHMALAGRGSRLPSALQREGSFVGGNDDDSNDGSKSLDGIHHELQAALAFQQTPRWSLTNRRSSLSSSSSTSFGSSTTQLLSTNPRSFDMYGNRDPNLQFRNNFGSSTRNRRPATQFRERGGVLQNSSPRSLETVRDTPLYSPGSQGPFQNRGRRPFGVRRTKNRNGENRSVFRDDNGRRKNLRGDPFSPVRVEGDSLKTWSFLSPDLEFVRVTLETDGRPLDAEIDLWQGPDNTPYKVRAYVENAYTCPINFMVETPRGPNTNTIAVRNVGGMEFPLSVNVTTSDIDQQISDAAGTLMDPQSSYLYTPRLVQGGAVRSFPFDSFVENVQIMLKSEGRPISARIEFLQGPNNVKQILEFYADDGLDRPLFAVVETPGSANVVRIVNTAPMEYPLVAWVEPLMVGRPRHDAAGGFLEDDGVLIPWHEMARAGSPAAVRY